MDKENDIKKIVIVILSIVVALGVFVTVRSCTKKEKDKDKEEVVEKEKDKDDDIVEVEEEEDYELVAVIEEPDTLGLQDCYIITSNTTEFKLPTVTLGNGEVLNITYVFQAKGTNGYVQVDGFDSTRYGIYKLTYMISNNGRVIKKQVVTIVINEPTDVDTSVLENTINGANILIGEVPNEAGIQTTMNNLLSILNSANTLLTSPLRTQEAVDQMVVDLSTARAACLNTYLQLVSDANAAIAIVQEMNANPKDSTDPEKIAALELAEEKLALVPSGVDKAALTENLKAVTDVEVDTEEELQANIANVLVKNIKFIDDITLTSDLIISGKTKVIDGDGNSLLGGQPISMNESDIELIDLITNSPFTLACDHDYVVCKLTFSGNTELNYLETANSPVIIAGGVGENQEGIVIDNRTNKVTKSVLYESDASGSLEVVNRTDTYYFENGTLVTQRTVNNDKELLRVALQNSEVDTIILQNNISLLTVGIISADHRTITIKSDSDEIRKLFINEFTDYINHGENIVYENVVTCAGD